MIYSSELIQEYLRLIAKDPDLVFHSDNICIINYKMDHEYIYVNYYDDNGISKTNINSENFNRFIRDKKIDIICGN